MVFPCLLAVLALPQHVDLEPIPPSFYDGVVELEIGVGDPPLEGYGPAIAYEYEVEFEGTLHLWTESELDLAMRVENLDSGQVFQDDGSGGGEVPYLKLEVQPGDYFVIMLASKTGAGSLELRLVASPETDATLSVAGAVFGAAQRVQVLYRDGDPEAARVVIDTTVGDLLEVPGGEHSQLVADRLWDMGFLARDLGALSAQLGARSELRRHRLRTLPPDHEDLVSASINLALARKEAGDFLGALVLEQEANEIWERLRSPDDLGLLRIKHNLAVTYKRLGDPERALALEEHVHAARERLLPKDDPDLLGIKLNLSVSRMDLGDLEGARVLAEYVHAALERTHEPGHPDLLGAKLNLALVRKDLGDLEGALALEEEMYSSLSRLLPAGHPQLLVAMGNVAGTRWQVGDLEGALELYEQAHAGWQDRQLPAQHPDLLRVQGNLAVARKALGDVEGALELERQVLEARESSFQPDHLHLLAARQNLARSYAELGEIGRALELGRALLEDQLAQAVALRTESPRAARASARFELQRLTTGLLLCDVAPEDQRTEFATRVFEVLENLRTVSTGSAEALRLVARLPELEDLRVRVSRARRALNDHSLTFPGPDAVAIEDWHDELLVLGEDRDRLEKQLRSELARHGDPGALTVESIADALDDRAALVSFFRFGRDTGDPSSAMAPLVDSLVAFVVTPDAIVHRVDLGPCREIEVLADAWRSSIGAVAVEPALAEGGDRGIGSLAASAQSAGPGPGPSLRAALLDPCLAVLADSGVSTLHVIPDDFLHLLPMDALPGPDSGIVGDQLTLRTETSIRRLTTPVQPNDAAGTLLVVGDVDFGTVAVNQPSSRADGPGVPPRAAQPSAFVPLAQTGPEIDAVAALYKQEGEDEAVVLRGRMASKRALHQAARGARFLHAATHGWFAPEIFRPTLDSARRTGQQSLVERVEETIRGFGPETLCGIALAGANLETDGDGRLPGVMTAEEMATLNLSNCELAVLSACETNVGVRRAGQGIQSLQAALQAAGARASITSLWRVDDAATRKLFERFYTYLWVENAGKADALWKAKMDLRGAGHPTRDWAGWVLTGDPD